MISAGTDVSDALGRDGYCLLPAERFALSPRTEQAFVAFRHFWSALEPDPYIKTTPATRLRRHAQFRYEPSEQKLYRLPDGPYFQTLRSNPLYGGQPREFTPFTEEAAENAFFRDLVHFNVAQFGKLQRTLHIHAHMVRILGRAQAVGEPSPEGIHQDGFDFISIHLINRMNVVGGETIVRNGDDDVLVRIVLASPLDSLYMDDHLLFHSTSAISPSGPGEAVRDVLLMSYEHPTPVDVTHSQDRLKLS